ncbi:MAG: hypothetical protein R8K50_09865 [Mariprofundus sp.]
MIYIRSILMAVVMLCAANVHADDNLLDWLHDAGNALHLQRDTDDDDNDHARLLTLEQGETEMYPRISPDGKSMLVVSGKRNRPYISLRLVENGDPLQVVSDYDQQVMDSGAWYGSDQMTFLSYRDNTLSLWLKRADASRVRKLYRRLDGELRTPLLLDDGDIIAVRLSSLHHSARNRNKKNIPALFNNWEAKGYQSHIVRINAQGAENDLSPGTNPVLSPDGKRLVFSVQDGHSWSLFMMNTDGSDLVQLTEGQHVDVQPAWSEDGRWIVFTSNRGLEQAGHAGSVNWDIWLIGRDGGDLMRLSASEAKDGAPVISHGRVYFHSDRKVDKQSAKEHQLRGRRGGFHIWVIELPAKVS